MVVLCEGDPGFYGSYQHLHARLRGRFDARIVPGVSSVAAAAAAVGQPLVQHEESLTVLTGTLPPDVLRARLAGAGGDAVAILKLGREFGKVRAALADTGLLDRAWYVERAGTVAERIAPLGGVDPGSVPYMSLALIPGRGERAALAPRVTVVGLGPGDPGWLTPEAAAAIAAATDLVGYRTYLDRVPQRPGQHRHASGNTAEADRAALALDLAAKGSRVAVVSSGDPGVFAMASAVLEQAAQGDERWRDVDVEVLPGVTAAQAVASRAGAPLGHDYCVISLSDRLKPWEVIADRIDKAAAADLVLALYNPASRARTWQVGAVRDLVLRHRPPADTCRGRPRRRTARRAGQRHVAGRPRPGGRRHEHPAHHRLQHHQDVRAPWPHGGVHAPELPAGGRACRIAQLTASSTVATQASAGPAGRRTITTGRPSSRAAASLPSVSDPPLFFVTRTSMA